MDNMISLNNRANEYLFSWGKPFRFLALRTYDTKLVINNTSLVIDKERLYLGFIRGKKVIKTIPINKINMLETKKQLSFIDLAVAGALICAGFFLNPLFFPFVLLAFWACTNTNIIVSTKDNEVIKIPTSNKESSKEFIRYFNDIYIEA